jgi:hypothetical protein
MKPVAIREDLIMMAALPLAVCVIAAITVGLFVW